MNDFSKWLLEYNKLVSQIQTNIKTMSIPNIIVNSSGVIRSVDIKKAGYYQFNFLNNKIIVGEIDSSHLHLKVAANETNWVKIHGRQIPCYLEGTSEKELKVFSPHLTPISAYVGTNPIIINKQKCKDDLKEDFKDYQQMYNLSQDEIDSIIKEIKEEQKFKYNPNVTQIIPMSAGTQPFYLNAEDWKLPTNPNETVVPTKTCAHEWAIYQGLNHSDTYCKKCNEIKK